MRCTVFLSTLNIGRVDRGGGAWRPVYPCNTNIEGKVEHATQYPLALPSISRVSGLWNTVFISLEHTKHQDVSGMSNTQFFHLQHTEHRCVSGISNTQFFPLQHMEIQSWSGRSNTLFLCNTLNTKAWVEEATHSSFATHVSSDVQYKEHQYYFHLLTLSQSKGTTSSKLSRSPIHRVLLWVQHEA